jgi:hypothetical protein
VKVKRRVIFRNSSCAFSTFWFFENNRARLESTRAARSMGVASAALGDLLICR